MRRKGAAPAIAALALLAAAPLTAQTPDVTPADAIGTAESTATAAPAAAATAEAGEPSEETRRKLEEIARRIELATEKESVLLQELSTLEQEIAARDEELASIQAAIDEYRRQSEESRARMESLADRIDEKRRWLKRRLRSLYIHGRPGYLKVFFAAESYADLVRRTKFSRILAQRDSELVAELKVALAEVAEARSHYEQDLALLDEELARARGTNEDLAAQRAFRQKLLGEVTGERASFEKLKAALEATDAALGERVASLGGAAVPKPARSFDKAKGTLLPPLAGGSVKLGFGPYRHPTLGLPMKHQGIAWTCAAGEEVKAVFDGRVEMSEWFSTYGRVIVIDHGDGWRSLYAHNSKLLKKKGEIVREGEAVALTGDTGSFDGAELFFALYRHGEPVDPAEWFLPR